MKLIFWGAAKTVTGSMHLVAAAGKRIALDCGLYQGRRQESFERNQQFPCDPAQALDAVVLSHAHIDHSGNLPTLVKRGYQGPVWATPATADLCAAMLQDSAYVQERDCEFVNKRRRRRRLLENASKTGDSGDNSVCPLYTVEDAEAVIPHFRPAPYHETVTVADGVRIRMVDAGHMLGSASLLLESDGIRLGFSGDIGRNGLPILRDPEPLPPVDYLILESTYGNRLHQPLDSVRQKLADVVSRTAARGGKIICPAFAVGRTQQLVVLLHELAKQHRIPSIPVYVDSPLAINVTEVYRRHSNLFDEETRKLFLDDGDDPFGFRMLRYVRTAEQSKALNDLRTPFLVISASGMCEAGRVLHHLRNAIEDHRNTVLITGFQAEHTLGRKLVDKLPEVPVFGELLRLRAEVVKINELSGHADQQELLDWMRPLAKGLKGVFLVHGEFLQQQALAEAIRRTYGVAVAIPARGEEVWLER